MVRRFAIAVVDFGGSSSVEALVAPYCPEAVFTPAERRYCARGGRALDHWAGRMAAKRSVLALLCVEETEDSLGGVEVGVGPHEGTCRPELCDRGHRPVVDLVPELRSHAAGQGIGVSISHAAGRAVAVAAQPGEGSAPSAGSADLP